MEAGTVLSPTAPARGGGPVLVVVVAALALAGCVTGSGGVLPPLADGAIDGALPPGEADSDFNDIESSLPDGEVVADAGLDARRPDLERPPIDENVPEHIETATFSLG